MSDDRQRSTVTGRVDVTSLLRAGQRRTVRTYLPPDYEFSARDYPVLYMFDGHNLFDETTSSYGKEWSIDETVEALCSQGDLDGLIVVGIDAPREALERYAEYTAWDWTHHSGAPVKADGDTTLGFLLDAVIPYTESTYRVSRQRGDRGIAGSSMGGYMTIYAATRHADVFSTALAFSPVTLQHPMAGDRLRAFVMASGAPTAVRFYLDMGDAEHLDYIDSPAQLVANLHEMADCLEAAGHTTVIRRVAAGAVHDEIAWGERFGDVVRWAFAGGPIPPEGP